MQTGIHRGMADAPKRKQPSGAQNRKRKAERLASEHSQRQSLNELWSQIPSYGTGMVIDDPGAVELPLYGQSPPTQAKAVAAVLTQLEQGAFYSPGYLVDGMMRDERIASALQTRIGGLLGAPFEMLPGADTAQGEKVAEQAMKLWPRMAPNPQMFEWMRYALMLGVGIAQVLTARDVKSTTPTMMTWNPRFMRWDWSLRRYMVVTAEDEIAIEPGDPQWLVYEPLGPHGWLSSALLRQLAQPWLIRYWTRQWWSRFQEVHGTPIRAGIIPQERTPADEKVFLTQLKTLGSDAAIRLPQGGDGNNFDVKLIEAASNSWQGFEKLLGHCDSSISIAILGQSQSVEGQGGLGTQEKAGESTIVRVLKQDAHVSDALRNQLLRPWAIDNFGDPDLAPHPTYGVEPPEDLKERATQLSTMATAINTLANLPPEQRHVDIRALLESFELPLLPIEEVEANAEDAEEKAAEIAEQNPPGEQEEDEIEEQEGG